VAALDEVAYIMPASADLVAGNPVMGCAGAVTEAGPVGDYVAVGSGWPPDSSGAVVLNYYFQSLTDKLSADVVQAEIERAFNEWQRYAKVTISPGGSADTARTLAIQFAHGAHGDNYPFDPAGQILAHTFYPAPVNPEPLAGDMHFNADEAWHTGGADIDLFSVALHETGHALGLGHSDQPGAVMYPYYRFASGLTDDDIAGIRFLYGSRDTQAVPQPPATPAPPTPTPPAPTPPSNPPVNPPAQPPAQGPDTTPPSLTITTPSSTIVSTSSASILVSGTAADNVGVTAVKFSNSVGDSGFASGTSSWSAQIDLLVGTNVITIRAYDAAGNSAWRSVTVVRH
jgi:hypothetical protein